LFGSKLKKEKKEAEEVKVAPAGKHDISSEIYWTCLHVPEVQDFTKKEEENVPEDVKVPSQVKVTKKAEPQPKKVPLESKKIAKQEAMEDLPEVKPTKTLRKPPKKLTIVPEVLLPENLSKLKNQLPSVKFDITERLSSNFQPKVVELRPQREEQDIPFQSPQLRDIPNFPLFISRINRIVNDFEKFVPIEASIPKPSVSKVLQATMPENQRNALIHWKQLKIAELGLEGFEVMQKCEISARLSSSFLNFSCFCSSSDARQAIPRVPSTPFPWSNRRRV
jgi:hypothetical protein